MGHRGESRSQSQGGSFGEAVFEHEESQMLYSRNFSVLQKNRKHSLDLLHLLLMLSGRTT